MRKRFNVTTTPLRSKVLRVTGMLSCASLVAVAATSSALAHDRTASLARTTATAAAAHVRSWLQVGTASWYGRAFQGRRTAMGERFDRASLTCAHRSLPLGSWIRVTNLSNSKSVFVRVNDRGPYVGNRIVDLSQAAAQAVDLHGPDKVRLEAVNAASPELARALVAQVGSDDPLRAFTGFHAAFALPGVR